jgi:CRP/FNR family transcriptional regulator, cyclic AMP receptor protein
MPSGSPSLEDLLLSSAWVQMLPNMSKDRVIADCRDRVYGAREFVAHRGEPATSWIGVADGLLKVSTITAFGRAMMFTAVPSGSWVGEGSVIKREPRRYDLMAIRPTRVIHVPRATFMWLLETSVEFNRYVIDHLNERTGQFLAMLEVSRITDPTGRVAGAICNLFNPVLYPKAGPLLNISQEEIGELAGLSRSTTNMAITRLKKLKLVNTEYGGLLILDLDRLRAFVHSTNGAEEDDGTTA